MFICVLVSLLWRAIKHPLWINHECFIQCKQEMIWRLHVLCVSDPCSHAMARSRGRRLSGAICATCARSKSVWLIMNLGRTLSIEEADGSSLEHFSSLRLLCTCMWTKTTKVTTYFCDYYVNTNTAHILELSSWLKTIISVCEKALKKRDLVCLCVVPCQRPPKWLTHTYYGLNMIQTTLFRNSNPLSLVKQCFFSYHIT